MSTRKNLLVYLSQVFKDKEEVSHNQNIKLASKVEQLKYKAEQGQEWLVGWVEYTSFTQYRIPMGMYRAFCDERLCVYQTFPLKVIR